MEDTYFLVTDVFTTIIAMADIIVEVRTNIFGDSLMVIRQELSPAVTGEIWYHCTVARTVLWQQNKGGSR